MPEFRVPSLVLSGAGCALALGPALAARGYRRAYVVSDPNVLATASAQAVIGGLHDAGLDVATHDGVTAEPTLDMVESALAGFQMSGGDVVIGLGGGSPMDTAKVVAVLARNPGPFTLYEGADKIPGGRAPVVCVATSAGTGSEVTRYVTVIDPARDRKMQFSDWKLLPDVAVADPQLTVGLPPRYTVSTGVDALTHAVEAYVSKRAQPLTDTLALSAIRRVGQSLRTAYREPENLAARAEMSLAALEAGMAFCNASVALVHGMARPLGAHFGVPHGLANAVLLARVCAFSAPAAAARYADVAAALGHAAGAASSEAGAQAAVDAIATLCADLDVPSLGQLGVGRAKFDAAVSQMALDAIASGSPANNPRPASQDEIIRLYQECF